jgi:hypothetical protein
MKVIRQKTPREYRNQLLKRAFNEELRKQLLQKIEREWAEKWQAKGHGEVFKGIDQLPSVNKFTNELFEDIDRVAKGKAPSQSSIERFFQGTALVNSNSDAIALYLGYASWQEFKEKNKESIIDKPILVSNLAHSKPPIIIHIHQEDSVTTNTLLLSKGNNTLELILKHLELSKELPPNEKTATESTKKRDFSRFLKILKRIGQVLAMLLLLFLSVNVIPTLPMYKESVIEKAVESLLAKKFTPEQLSKVKFEVIKQIRDSSSAHVMYQLAYDVSALDCEKVRIVLDDGYVYFKDYNRDFSNKLKDTIDFYIEKPTFAQFVLSVDRDVKIDSIPIYVPTTRGWEVWQTTNERLGNSFHDCSIKQDGNLHYLGTIDETGQNLYTHFRNVRDFDISGDELIAEYRFRNAIIDGGLDCQTVGFRLYNEYNAEGYINCTLLKRACIPWANFRIGESQLYNGRKPKKEAEKLTLDMEQWHTVRIETKNQLARLYVDNELVYQTKYKAKVGNIKGISFLFRGSGIVDYVKLQKYDGKIIYEENFDGCSKEVKSK